MRRIEEVNADLTQEMQRHGETVTALQSEYAMIARSVVSPAAKEDHARKNQLTPQQQGYLLTVLERRLSEKVDHYQRPEGINFTEVKKALEADPAALWSLWNMQETGGEPDIVAVEENAFLFADCSAESPAGRRDCVFDTEAEKSAVGTFNGNAVDMAAAFGVELWSPEFYRKMQETGEFDRNTWSWLQTDADTRSSGGARYGDCCGDRVGVHQYDARDHYGVRAWRGLRRVQKA